MPARTSSATDPPVEAVTCPHLAEDPQMAGYRLGAREVPEVACLSCALRDPKLLGRSLRVAAVVGTFLVLLNQAEVLFAPGPLRPDLWWRIPLTYCVPFAVATYGAISNARRGAAESRRR